MYRKFKLSIVLFILCKLQNILVIAQHYEVTLDTQECRLTPVLQFIQYPGCVQETLRSYACIGKCTSYVQIERLGLLSTLGQDWLQLSVAVITNAIITSEVNGLMETLKHGVSGSKIWQMERSCNCCQESVETETLVTLECPEAPPGESKYRTVTAKSPLECMCRPCSTFDESEIVPQEIASFAEESLSNFFRKSLN